MLELLIILAIVWMIFAIVQDFKTREVANWLNFSLIIFALAIRLFYSIFLNNYNYFLFGLFGLGVCFILGYLFYYLRLFAGGDAKLLIALGAVIPFANDWYNNVLIFFVFTISLLFLGALYSLIYSLSLVFLNKKVFIKEFKKQWKLNKNYSYVSLILGILVLIFAFVLSQIAFSVISALFLITPLLFIYAKSVENSCMIKYVDVKDLTIGDWLIDSIKIKSRIIKPYWEGLTEEQVNFIKKNYKKKVLIKYGIPFTPSFLLAFLAIVAIKYLWNSNWGFWQFF